MQRWVSLSTVWSWNILCSSRSKIKVRAALKEHSNHHHCIQLIRSKSSNKRYLSEMKSTLLDADRWCANKQHAFHSGKNLTQRKKEITVQGWSSRKTNICHQISIKLITIIKYGALGRKGWYWREMETSSEDGYRNCNSILFAMLRRWIQFEAKSHKTLIAI